VPETAVVHYHTGRAHDTYYSYRMSTECDDVSGIEWIDWVTVGPPASLPGSAPGAEPGPASDLGNRESPLNDGPANPPPPPRFRRAIASGDAERAQDLTTCSRSAYWKPHSMANQRIMIAVILLE
jgi:hypothetical protein